MQKWTAYGQYVTAGKIKQLEPYEEFFKLNETDRSKARAIVQNGLIEDHLRKTQKNFHHVYTCQLYEKSESIESKDEGNITLETLVLEATELGCLPAVYKSLKGDKAREQSLKEAIEKKKARMARAKKKKSSVEDQGWV